MLTRYALPVDVYRGSSGRSPATWPATRFPALVRKSVTDSFNVCVGGFLSYICACMCMRLYTLMCRCTTCGFVHVCVCDVFVWMHLHINWRRWPGPDWTRFGHKNDWLFYNTIERKSTIVLPHILSLVFACKYPIETQDIRYKAVHHVHEGCSKNSRAKHDPINRLVTTLLFYFKIIK